MDKKTLLKRFAFVVPDEFSDPFNDYLKDLRTKRLNILFFFSIFLIPGAFIFDLLIFPEQWLHLLKARLVSMTACMVLYFISRKTLLRDYPVFMTHQLNLVVAVTIAYLTFQTGAYASPYYAGFILIFICMAMVMPLGFKGTLIAGCVILGTHVIFNLIPPILAGEPFLWPRFWNSIYFLTFSFSMVLIASAMIQNYIRQIFVTTEEERKRSKQLDEQKQKIDSLSKTRNRFIANITHELKTPLSIVIGNTDLLLDEVQQLQDSEKNQLRVVQQAAFQLATHVDRIISISVVDDPELKLNTDVYDYLGIVNNIIPLFDSRAQESGINFKNSLPDKQLIADVDMIRIEEVLNNLLQNAFKFSEPGDTVTISVRSDGTHIISEVADSGVGIPEEKLDQIFERLSQVDDELSKRHGGIGVGLYLCKRNIELHGGTISVSSTPGKGTSFRFTLPLHLDQSITAKNTSFSGGDRREDSNRRMSDRRNKERRSTGRRFSDRRSTFEYQQNIGVEELSKMTHIENIGEFENLAPSLPSILIVEDNPGMMKVIVDALVDEYNLFLAMDGGQALKKLNDDDGKISLILSDIMMPGMSGFDFCRQLMKVDKWKHIPLIFVTALMKEEEQLKGYTLGATDYIIKPYNIKILKEKVAHWISRRQYELLLVDISSQLEIRLNDISKMKDIILHEIKNPLQLLMGADFFLQNLRSTLKSTADEKDRDRQLKGLEMLNQGLESIKGVIDTSKDLSRDGSPNKSVVSVEDLFAESISQTSHLLKGIRLETDFNELETEKLFCDQRMLIQVLVNLIRNAAEAIGEKKNRKKGTVHISTTRKEDDRIRIDIEDNGAGIPEAVKKNLFKFKYTTKKDGTGVGLHLSKMIIKLHQGSISMDSTVGAGTTFSITLPIMKE